MKKKSPKMPIDRRLACMLMCALTLHLNILPIHELAFAEPPPPCSDEDPAPPELQELLQTQKTIHESVFSDRYNSCDDFVYLLRDEVLEAPSIVAGKSAEDEAFTLKLSLVARFSAWEDVNGLTQQQIQDLNGAQAAVSFIKGDLERPAGSRRIGAISFSMNVVGGRVSLLMPIIDFGAIALPMVDSCNEYADAAYYLCRRNAIRDFDDCADDADDAFWQCVDNTVITGATGVVVCLLAAGITAASGGAAAAVAAKLCYIGGGVALGALTIYFNNYGYEIEECEEDLWDDLEECCDEARLRFSQGGGG